MPEALFNGELAEQFGEYEHTLRGFVRYEIAHRNLEKLVNGETLHVADVGGGSGLDTAWLAGLGHQVDLIEPAHDQLMLAKDRLSQFAPEVQDRVQLHEATAADMLDRHGAGRYDLVLSHCVVMYLPRPDKRIAELVSLAKPGGNISLMERGLRATQVQLAERGDLQALEKLADERKVTNGLRKEVRVFSPFELQDYLNAAGVVTSEWYGVRIATERLRMLTAVLPVEDRDALLDLEYTLGHDEATKGVAKLIHMIAQKH